MSWPVNPIDTQETTINGVVYRYDSAAEVWNRVRQIAVSTSGGGSYTNSNVATYLPTYTGNLSPGNIKTDNLLHANGTAFTVASFTNDASYATENFVTSKNYLTSSSLSGYATETFVTSKNYLTSSSLTGYATETYVSTQISNLVASAPTALDTLNELANALGNDASYSTTITNALANKLSTSNFASTANTWISTKSTSNLSEGTNLYYTDTRANSAIDTRVTKSFIDNLAVVSNISNISYSVAGANVSGQVGNALVSGTVYTNAQPNITSVGTLTSLTVSGTSTFKSSQDVTISGTPSGTVNYDLYNGVVFDVAPTANWTANVSNIATTNNRTTVVTFIITQGSTPYVPNVFQISGTAQTVKWIGGTAPTGTASKIDVVSYSMIRSSGGAWTVLGQSGTYG